MKLRTLSLAALIALGAPLGTVWAQLPSTTEVPPGQLAQSDVEFLQDANSANIAQIAMAHAAESAAKNPGVRALATRIASSHNKADQALRLMAPRKHVDLPRTANATDNGEIAELHTHKKGGDFDAQYVRDVLADHDRMIRMYEAARNGSMDADIRGYADTMLPALRQNRDQAAALTR
jgi:putative membrane protein